MNFVPVDRGTARVAVLLGDFMRSAWLAAVALLVCGCAAAAAKQVNVHFRELRSGSYAASSSPAPQIVIATDAGSYGRIWNALIGSGAPPEVDFATESAVFLVDKERRSGGYSLEPKSVTIENGTATIGVFEHAPGAGSVTTQALTTPFTVIAVRASRIAAARWTVESTGAVVAETAKKR